MRKLLFLCLIPAALWAQQYYEASDQTRVFTLTAGAKAGPTAILSNLRSAHSCSPYMLVTSQNGLRIIVNNVQGSSRVSIYTLAGKSVQSAVIVGKSIMMLKSDLPRGVYFARLEMNGRILETTRFWKAR